jgi:protein-disulfide isomerase
VSEGAILKVPVGPEDHTRGSNEAPLIIVEYGDYQCPYCAQAHLVVEEILNSFGTALRFVFRNFPLVDVHPYAEAAAEMAEAAGFQGKFWEMHNALFENQSDLRDTSLVHYAQGIGLDTSQVQTDLTSGRPRERVEADFEGGIRSGSNGTPTFFVNGTRYDGSWQREPFAAFLTAALES